MILKFTRIRISCRPTIAKIATQETVPASTAPGYELLQMVQYVFMREAIEVEKADNGNSMEMKRLYFEKLKIYFLK